jgi:hypothetical protein
MATININGVQFIFSYGKTTPQADMADSTVYLDGAVQGPVIDNDRRSYSFDHHAGCVRAFTLASCQQVAQALELGWDNRGLDVVVNDLDADTMVSAWLILHPERIREERVQELVNRVGFVDAHGPAIPGHKPHPLHFALTPRYGQEQTEELFRSFLATLDNWFETGKEPSAREDRPAPAFGLTADGELNDLGAVTGFEEVYKTCVVGVVMVPGVGDTVGYTVGKVSDFVSYDIKAFLARCNEIESGWGGGSTIGGAPRLEGGKRSSLTRSQVEEILLAGVVKR